MSNEMIDHAIQAWILLTIFVGIPSFFALILELFFEGKDDD